MAALLSPSLAVLTFAPVALALATLLAVAPAARAADGDGAGIAVLGIEALDAQDNAIANDITEALRQRVTSGKLGSAQLQGKDLVELKLIFSCGDEAPACLAQAGKSLGASELLFGNIKRSGGELTLNLKLLDASRGVVEGSTAESLPKRKLDAAALRPLAAQWLAKLNGGGKGSGVPGATLVIRSNVAGATITLDGAEAGVTTKKGLTLADIAPGKHEITAEKPGYGRISQQFSVGASQSLPLTLALQPDGTEPAEGDHEAATRPPPMRDEPASEDSLRGWMGTGFWVALGVTAVSLGLATKYGLDVRSANKDLDPYRNVMRDLTEPEKQTVTAQLDKGNRAETRQWIFVGVGSAFAVASGFLFFYKGYLDKEAGSGTRTSDNHGLRIFPTANTATGGIAAEFDF